MLQGRASARHHLLPRHPESLRLHLRHLATHHSALLHLGCCAAALHQALLLRHHLLMPHHHHPLLMLQLLLLQINHARLLH